MRKSIKNIFNRVQAEEQLKRNTRAFLQDKIQRKTQKNQRAGFWRAAIVVCCLTALFLTGLFSHEVYYTEAMYVDVDMNPSVELTLNRFDRVIGAYAYNAPGEELLAQLKLRHKSLDHAVVVMTRAAVEKGFLTDGGLVSVTLQSGGGSQDMLIKTLQAEILSAAQMHQALVQVEAFAVDGKIREQAHEQNISPAKYMAIMELQKVDPAATVEGCRGHSIGEIRSLTQGHHLENQHGAAVGPVDENQHGAAVGPVDENQRVPTAVEAEEKTQPPVRLDDEASQRNPVTTETDALERAPDIREIEENNADDPVPAPVGGTHENEHHQSGHHGHR